MEQNVFDKPSGEAETFSDSPEARKGRMQSNVFDKPSGEAEIFSDSPEARKGRMKSNVFDKPSGEAEIFSDSPEARKGRIKSKTILVIALILLFLAAAGTIIRQWQKKRQTRVVFDTEVITRGDMENSVTATGTVEPLEQVEVGTQVSGIIDKIYVDYNSRVKKGDVIAELDKTVLQTELASAGLSVQSSRNEYLYQEKNFRRTASLYEKKLVSDSEYETAEYTCRKAKIAYEQALAQEEKARTNLGYATIYSPIDGVVISRAVEVGQTVASSFSTPTLFTIANDLHKVQVVADVDEADIGQVQEGAEVTFTVDAYPEILFEGKVYQVRMEAITTNNVVTYEVVIHAENPELKLKPGLTANINIYSMRRTGVLRLPVKATRFRPEGSEPAGRHDAESDLKKVYVWQPSETGSGFPEPKARKVRVGVSDKIYYEVLDGLQEGEIVCLGVMKGGAAASKSVSGTNPFMPGPPGRGNNRSGKK